MFVGLLGVLCNRAKTLTKMSAGRESGAPPGGPTGPRAASSSAAFQVGRGVGPGVTRPIVRVRARASFGFEIVTNLALPTCVGIEVEE